MNLIVALGLLAVTTSCACALPGVFLVVRRQSMLVDAMSHAVFPGIVLGALVSGTTRSPWMVVIAVVSGLVVVLAAEKFRASGLVTADASQGLVFPVLFAIGIAIVSTELSSVHLSESTVLAGDMNLMALSTERWVTHGFDMGPQMAWWALGVFVVNAAFVAVTYRILHTSSFDPHLARTMGMPAGLVSALLMVLIAITIVVAFSAVGTVLVIALMIVPAATARLLTNRLAVLVWTTLAIAVVTPLIGLAVASSADLATAPMMACIDGMVFLLVWAARLAARRISLRRPHRDLQGVQGALS